MTAPPSSSYSTRCYPLALVRAGRAIAVTFGVAIALLSADPGAAQTTSGTMSAAVATITCASVNGGRTQCPANTSAGVVLQRTTGTAACLLGRSWGYDDKGVWVSEGCSGEFLLSAAGAAPSPEGANAPQTAPVVPGSADNKPYVPIELFGEFTPGDGFLVGRSAVGELAVSGYVLVRYMNQIPDEDTFTDHLGNERPVDGRNDIYSHRVMLFFKGWLGTQKLIYSVVLWTVNPTDQRAIFGNVGYQFSRKFGVYAGLNGSPGTRSLQGSHPYWLGNDRVMADEFFRPYFGSGAWVQGEITPGLWYNAMVSNNNSALGTTSSELDRTLSSGASMWWMPTTKEFGPRGGYGDWENHEKLATRFGFSSSFSPEQRFTNSTTNASENTTLRLADSVNVFDRGALAPDVTVQNVDFGILSFDAGMKYRGIFLQAEMYTRWLDEFQADGPLPVSSIVDKGFFLQGAFYPVPKKLELYASTSQIFGDKSAGFDNSNEYLTGMNFYPTDSRNHRLNLQYIRVNKSPVSSAFGYYTAGIKGSTFAAAFSVFF